MISLCSSLWLRREHILDFLRVHYASMRECQFAILECPAVACPYKVFETLSVFQMTVLMILQPVYAVCQCRVWSEVAYIDKSVLAFQEETEDKGFYLFV